MPPWLWSCHPAWHELDPLIQNFMKFLGGRNALARGQVRLATRIEWDTGPRRNPFECLSAARLGQFIGSGNLEKFDRSIAFAGSPWFSARNARTDGR